MKKVSLFDVNGSNELDSKYTSKITAPQYIPKGEMPSIYSLCNTKKYKELCEEIDKSNVPEEEKEFLKLAATRHIVFEYGKIAEYYCHTSVETQRLMEKSALVIIDFDDAMLNGYVKLDKTLSDLAVDTLKRKGVI